MNKRSRARETLMQLVFQMEARNSSDRCLMKAVMDEAGLDDEQKGFVQDNFTAIAENIESIDDMISAHLVKWTLNRLPKTDLAILRVAIGESVFGSGLEKPVAVNEAVEMAKKYCGEKSPSFVNGILGKVLE